VLYLEKCFFGPFWPPCIDLWCPQAQEAELQKLLQVHLKLPSTALWFEPPTIGEPKYYLRKFALISMGKEKQKFDIVTSVFSCILMQLVCFC
jgi:hypothetical protein